MERKIGIKGTNLVEVYGSFRTSRCIECGKHFEEPYFDNVMRKNSKDITRRMADIPRCTECNGVIKPDITLPGEPINKKFQRKSIEDSQSADLLLILGTRLSVQPFCSFALLTNINVPRVYLNDCQPKYAVDNNIWTDWFTRKTNKHYGFKRSTDVTITSLKTEYVLADMANCLKWTRAIENAK